MSTAKARKRVFFIMIAYLLPLSVSIAASADEAKAKATSEKYRSAHGTIVSVDATAQTFTLKRGKDISTFKVDSDTRYRSPGGSLGATVKPIRFSDLQIGDNVRVSYTENGPEKTAARVDVTHHTGGDTTDPGPACPSGSHRCKQGCCKD